MPHFLQDLIFIIGVITTVMLLIFSTFLISTKKWKKLRVKILFYFLIVNTIYIFAYLIITFLKPATLIGALIFYILHFTGFLFGPILFYYTKITIYGEYKFRKSEFAHLTPFFVSVIYVLLRLILSTKENQVWLSNLETIIFGFLVNIQVLFYMVYAIIKVRKYRRKIIQFYSSLNGVYYSWLTPVLYGFFLMWLIDLIHFSLDKIMILSVNINLSSTAISLLINFIFAVLIFFKGLTHPELFNYDIKEEKPKYEKSKLTKEEADAYLTKLQNFMKDKKPYLNSNLNINELADKVDIPMRYLSQIINDLLQQNFFDFINFYRIEESKNYLSDYKYKKLNILEVLYEVGFNSKSTFNKVFKEYTGLTPTEYRQQKLLKY
jgi:AraC-like DNA-binding protein